MANTNTKKEDSSNPKAAQPITPACFNMLGMAMPPRVDAPVKNLAKFTQLLSDSEYIEEPSDPAKSKGIGRSTYVIALSIGHQLLYKAHAKICKTIPPETKMAKKRSFPVFKQ
jgi:hypothetical protein